MSWNYDGSCGCENFLVENNWSLQHNTQESETKCEERENRIKAKINNKSGPRMLRKKKQKSESLVTKDTLA